MMIHRGLALAPRGRTLGWKLIIRVVTKEPVGGVW